MPANPFATVDKMSSRRQGITVATPQQVRQALLACRDHRQDITIRKELRIDATGALAAVAILFFSGIRPQDELGALEWQGIDMAARLIRVPARAAKTRTGRFVPINDTLMEWLESVPADRRTGRVCGTNWKRKWELIRKSAGFRRKGDEDIARHSFATYCYLQDKDTQALRAALGHGTTDVLFNHYVDADIHPDVVQQFWQIRPATANLHAMAG